MPAETPFAVSMSDKVSDMGITSNDPPTDMSSRAICQHVMSCLEDVEHGHYQGQIEKRIGSGIRELATCAKSAPVALFILLWAAKRLLNRQGCLSKFNDFLQMEVPFISRKTADRYASVIEHFSKGDPHQVARLARAMTCIDKTALYELAKPHVAHAARIQAIECANQGITVTKAVARQLVFSNGSIEPPTSERLMSRVFETSVGRVTFRLSKDDVKLALNEIANQLASQRS